MKLDEFTSELNKNIPKILDENIYIKVINRNNNLARFDIINKLAICTMNNEIVYDVKTKEEWFEQGRRIIDTSKIVRVIIPNYTSEYIDSLTGKTVDITQFTRDEFVNALRLNIIKKESKFDGMYVQDLYDIRNTCSIDKNINYKIPKPIVSISVLFSILQRFTGITAEESDETYLAKQERHLYLAKGSYSEMIDTLASILTDYLLEPDILRDCIQENLGNTEKELSKAEIKLLRASIIYSIKTLFNINNKEDILSVLKDKLVTDYIDLIDILTITDSIVFKIIQQLEYTDNSSIEDATNNMLHIKKAEILLDIMQANSIQLKMKGV